MNISTVIFDLDDTLYPSSNGVWSLLKDRINQYMIEYLGYTKADALKVQIAYFNKYGTTLRGLQIEHQIDPLHYLHFVHDVPIQKVIKPNLLLKQILSTIQQKKVIFTNADRWHANRVIEALDIQLFFDEIVDIMDIQPYCKPMPEAFEIAINKLGIRNPSTCLFIDDSLRNITVADSLGLQTVWVSDNDKQLNFNKFRINKIEEIIDYFPNEFNIKNE